MEKDAKNRFNERKPFDVVRAEDFGGDLYEFYEPLEQLVRKVSGVDIKGSRPVFLIGGRGTGKTMVLKFLSLEMQLKDFIRNKLKQDKSISKLSSGEMKEFLNRKRFIGIYLRFKTIEYDSFKGEVAQLFKPYLSIKIAEKILKFLKTLKSFGLVHEDQERKITDFFLKHIIVPKPKAESNFESCARAIREDILPLFEKILEKKSFYSMDEIKRDHSIPLVIHKEIFFGLPDLIFNELDCLKGKNLFILLDELEYLNQFQTSCIGELIKNSDETSVIFKIGSRYMPKEIPVGESNEVLQEPHDHRVIHITDSLNAAHGKKTDYRKLIKSILNKRLHKSNFFKTRGITDIEQLFPNLSVEDEALALVRSKKEPFMREKHWNKFKSFLRRSKSAEEIAEIIDLLKYPDNPVIEKLNMLLYYRKNAPQEIKRTCEEYLRKENIQYTHLYQKNALNLLFQLHSDYRSEKKYAGIDVFIHLSSGIIRFAIEICNQALNTALNYGYELRQDNPVGVIYQDIGAKHHAKLQYDDIRRIPANLGLLVQEFINQIGTIFRALHEDRYLVEPEPTHFETDYSEIKEEAKRVFDAALEYSYLQRKPPMDPRKFDEAKKPDFLINRVFAPYFEISYNVRGRTYISASQIQSLIMGDTEEKKQTRREIIRENSRKKRVDLTQRTLLEMTGFRKNDVV